MAQGLDEQQVGRRRARDVEFLGLELSPVGAPGFPVDAGFELTAGLARHDGRLYGGTAVAVAAALAEAATDRPALWSTVQFVSGAAVVGDRITCRVEVMAHGHRTSQVRTTAWLGDDVLFCGVGATAHAKPDGLTASYEAMPRVLPPDECAPFEFPMPDAMRGLADRGIERSMEIRVATEPGAQGRRAAMRYWARARGHVATAPMIGYLADMVPMSIAHAAGRMGGGTSLDNTVRFGPPAEAEWVLLELIPHLARGGYGHGTGHVWSPDGELLATASQTAALILFD